MKKLISIFAVLLAMCVAMPATAQNKELEKALKKEYKTKIKELNKEGWKLAGSSRSLDVALLLHYEKLKDPNNHELPGEVSSCSSLNLCRQAALANACAYYASLAGGNVRGRAVSEGAMDQASKDGKEQYDRLLVAYERAVEKEIKGEIQESFSITRVNANGQNEYRTYFLINEDQASKARRRAWENALEESKAAQEYASKISDFINEGFPLD